MNWLKAGSWAEFRPCITPPTTLAFARQAAFLEVKGAQPADGGGIQLKNS